MESDCNKFQLYASSSQIGLVPYLYLLFQVTNAQKFGAKAILIYNDPQDFAPVPDEDLYPHGWWLPRSGVQRGSILIGTGDPLTPRYPSKGVNCLNQYYFTN